MNMYLIIKASDSRFINYIAS